MTDWFGRPVILLSSGRTGLDLFLRLKKFRRYEHRIQVPRFLSRCVLNALTYSAFPVEAPSLAQGQLYYHAYGFPQRGGVHAPLVIEDVAHAFFSSARTGERRWLGPAAVFSLPKFFTTAGLVGGLIVETEELVDQIRSLMASAVEEPPGVREWMRSAITCGSADGASERERTFIESAYELLFKFVKPESADLGGMAGSFDEIQRIGQARAEHISFFREFFRTTVFPENFWNAGDHLLPFALPYFGSGDIDRLRHVDAALLEQGVRAGLYRVDVNRNEDAPDYRYCVLLPCHHAIEPREFEAICKTAKAVDQ